LLRRIISDLTTALIERGGFTKVEAPAASFRPEGGWFRPITRREAAWLVVGSLGFGLLFSYPILGDVGNLGPGLGWITAGPVFSHLTRLPANSDWDAFTDQWWVATQTVSHFHQFPLWNPYKCGGLPMLGNPEAIVATPFLLLHVAFGLITGLYLQIILHLALGFAGGYVLARVMGLGAIAGLVLASVFPSTSWLYLQLAMGNLTLSMPTAYWPWMLALFFVGIARRKIAPLGVGGIMLALTAIEGNYTFIYAVILIGLISLTMVLTQRSVWPVFAAAVLVVFGTGIAAFRLLPSAEFLALYPRGGWAGPQDDTLLYIPTFLFSRNQDLYRNIPHLFVYACYGAYISPAFALLAVVGLLTGRLKILPWLVAAIVLLLLARGDTGPYCALALLRRLPLFGNMAFPTRFIGPFVFAVGGIAAYGADFICRSAGRWGPRAAGALFIIGLVDAWLVGPPNLRYMYRDPIPTLVYNTQFRQVWNDNTQVQTEYNEANLGVVQCYGHGEGGDSPTTVVGYNQKNYSGEYYLVGPGQVNQIEWTPNQLRYHVSVAAPTDLVVNQNYFPGWRVKRGVGDVRSRNGLLAVRVPAGSQDVTLRFWPTHFTVVLTFTLFGLIATIVLVKRGY
jgi:hypothetical protein